MLWFRYILPLLIHFELLQWGDQTNLSFPLLLFRYIFRILIILRFTVLIDFPLLRSHNLELISLMYAHCIANRITRWLGEKIYTHMRFTMWFIVWAALSQILWILFGPMMVKFALRGGWMFNRTFFARLLRCQRLPSIIFRCIWITSNPKLVDSTL